jgi:hypothetical protein
VESELQGKEARMVHTQRLTAAARERRAREAAALVRRVVEEACNQGHLAVLDAVLAPPAAGPDAPVRERLPALLAAFRAAVPDAHWAIVELVAADEAVVTRLAVRGHFSGPLVGLPPPGRPATLTGVAISRFSAGRLVALWLQADLLGLLTQVGVMPPLSLTQAVTMARVLHAGALLADEPARGASLGREECSEEAPGGTSKGEAMRGERA